MAGYLLLRLRTTSSPAPAPPCPPTPAHYRSCSRGLRSFALRTYAGRAALRDEVSLRSEESPHRPAGPTRRLTASLQSGGCCRCNIAVLLCVRMCGSLWASTGGRGQPSRALASQRFVCVPMLNAVIARIINSATSCMCAGFCCLASRLLARQLGVRAGRSPSTRLLTGFGGGAVLLLCQYVSSIKVHLQHSRPRVHRAVVRVSVHNTDYPLQSSPT